MEKKSGGFGCLLGILSIFLLPIVVIAELVKKYE